MNEIEKEKIILESKREILDISEGVEAKKKEIDKLINIHINTIISVIGFTMCPFKQEHIKQVVIDSNKILINDVCRICLTSRI